jgi:hypothetical protein
VRRYLWRRGYSGQAKEVEGKEVEKGTRRRGEGEEMESDIWICVKLIEDGRSEYQPRWLAL